MKPEEVLKDLQSKINNSLSLESALRIFIEYYEDTEVENCSKLDGDGDTLLCQWGGPYSWDNSVSINLTRQFIFHNAEGEYRGMQQLRMDCRFSPDDIQLESGNFWMEELSAEAFLQKVLESEAVKKTKDLKIQNIEFKLGNV